MKEAEQLSAFLQLLRDAESECRTAEEEERQSDLETQDINHRLELENDTYHVTARLAQLLRQVRRKRRAAKDIVERTKPLAEWAKTNKDAVKSLERLLGELRKIDTRQRNRMYLPRTKVLEEQCADKVIMTEKEDGK